MDHRHEWERAARAELCRLPLLDRDELGLFDWHVRVTQSLIDQMTADEERSTSEALAAGGECAGSGWIAVGYFVKRIRYGQLIFLVSLVETFLTDACERLKVAVGKQNILFELDELSGEKLARRRKFLKRYGHVSVSAELWEPIDQMISIRNICVHENGCVNSRGKISPDWPSGVTVDQGELVLADRYISDCRTAAGALTEHFEKEIRQVADRSMKPKAAQKVQ